MISQPLLQRFVVTTKLDGIAYDVDFSKHFKTPTWTFNNSSTDSTIDISTKKTWWLGNYFIIYVEQNNSR